MGISARARFSDANFGVRFGRVVRPARIEAHKLRRRGVATKRRERTGGQNETLCREEDDGCIAMLVIGGAIGVRMTFRAMLVMVRDLLRAMIVMVMAVRRMG